MGSECMGGEPTLRGPLPLLTLKNIFGLIILQPQSSQETLKAVQQALIRAVHYCLFNK